MAKIIRVEKKARVTWQLKLSCIVVSLMYIPGGPGEKSGSTEQPEMADRVVREYGERLLRLAKSRLGSKLQAKICPEDVVQSALMSFFRTQQSTKEKTHSPDAGTDLWGLLVVITLRKCLKWHDVFNADKRSVQRERSLNSGANDASLSMGILSREPGAEDVAIVCELSENLMQDFDQRHQEMLRLRLQGMEIEEIASAVRSSKRTVARVISKAKRKLQGLIEND